ncbi:protein-L-isoaspartate O-methyltransferase family protein [Brevundimonas aurifodinae]|uniref:Protein-L-isoaspartate O-methyltransferase n=2 Tax=Brevundimonas TaxID=41275 RepID=A0ABV1NKF4_9CAUL|nr:MAG: protein-L-isoaspartate O-methyltransferase [Brevundimonas sp. 12-68-7]OYX31409.1 MAG: protein-L-isoaspartate O-methyltransferase [Brevundimonas subvibrioides]
MDFAAARKVMVDSQVRVNDVTDRGLQAAMLAVPRERFCDPARAFSAYGEVEVEIAAGRRLMQAREVAKLIQALDPREGETALAVAAPYAAAVLARLGLTVTAQEAEAAVLDVVGPALSEAGVETAVASLSQPVGEGYDVVISEGAVAVRPEAWLAVLKVGGRLAVVERTGPNGRAVLYVKGREGVSRRELFDAAPPVLAEMTPAPAFAL